MAHTRNIAVTLPSGAGGSLTAYVVGKDGSILESAPFTDGRATLQTGKDTLKGARLFVGPPFPKDYPATAIDAYALTDAGAQQVSMNFTDTHEIAIRRLPGDVIIIPPFHFCDVVGNVTNTVTLDGVATTGPVCKARVHICTVDWYFRWPIWLRPVISENLLAELKDRVVALTPSIPIPPPEKINRPLRSITRTRKPAPSAASTLKPLPTHVQDDILNATPSTIHEIVYNHADILFPYFCWWPIFWPWFYRLTERTVATTDCNGHFDGVVFNFGALPVENIYVWVEALIGGVWTTVYRPPFPCATHWDYSCNTDIDINLTNPSIPPCNCEGQASDGTVWFTAIGNYGIALDIQQSDTAEALGRNTLGCTNLYDSNQLCPFGATLDLGLAFGSILPPAAYYRWKYTLAYDSALNPLTGQAPQYLTPSIARPYLWQKSDGTWQTGAINLQATDSGGNVANSIPNFDVTAYPGVPATAEWVSFNFVSAFLDSNSIPNGYVARFELELLNLDAAGLFTVVSVPDHTFQVSIDTDLSDGYGGSTDAPGAYLTPDTGISGNALALSLLVRVDNAPITIQLNPTTLAGMPAGPNPCGFLEYTDTTQDVILSFKASEPFGFATFGYTVSKGNVGVILDAGGYVFQSPSPFVLSAGTYTSSGQTVGDLLGGCTRAAFAENLTVYHLATNGSSPLWETFAPPYYGSTAAAFALTNS